MHPEAGRAVQRTRDALAIPAKLGGPGCQPRFYLIAHACPAIHNCGETAIFRNEAASPQGVPMYHKRLPYYLILSLAVLCIAPAALPQAKGALGAVVQTWTYDPTHNPPLVTAKIVNNSHKDITAFNMSIKETYANGHVYKHEVLEEFLGTIIALKEVQGKANEANFRKYYGDGVLHPGAVWDEKLPVQPELTDYQAVVDVVTYMDGTAESTNDDALGRIMEERQATVDSQKIAIEIIKSALGDANDPTPAMTAAKKIQDRANVWNVQPHTKLDLNDVYLESIANELKALSSGNGNRRDALQQIVNREEANMSVRSVHAALVKTGGPQ